MSRNLDPERRARHDQLEIVDSIVWCHGLLDSLEVRYQVDRIAVRPTCLMSHLGLGPSLHQIAERMAHEVYTPTGTTCCGTAGDRRLLHPELVRSATREEKAGLEDWSADAYVSTNRTEPAKWACAKRWESPLNPSSSCLNP